MAPAKKMSDAHKNALAHGRELGRAVRDYLEYLEWSKPTRGRKRDTSPERIAEVEAQIAEADSPLQRLQLIHARASPRSLSFIVPTGSRSPCCAAKSATTRSDGPPQWRTGPSWRRPEAGPPERRDPPADPTMGRQQRRTTLLDAKRGQRRGPRLTSSQLCSPHTGTAPRARRPAPPTERVRTWLPEPPPSRARVCQRAPQGRRQPLPRRAIPNTQATACSPQRDHTNH